MSERDTHFAGFAQNLMDELLVCMDHGTATHATATDSANGCRLILARRSYELAVHVVSDLGWDGNPESLVDSVSDISTFESEE